MVDAELDEIVTLKSGLRFQVIVDLIVEDKITKKLYAWDHKSRGKLADAEDMIMDPQLTRYFWALEALGYKNMGGVLYNEMCTKPPSVPQQLKAGGLSKRKDAFTTVDVYMGEIRRLGLDPRNYQDILRHIAVTQQGKFFKRTLLPKDPPMLRTMMRELNMTAIEILDAERRGNFPRTFIAKQCKWDCDFKDLCITQLHGADIKPLIKMNFEDKEQRARRERRERKKAERFMQLVSGGSSDGDDDA